MYKIIDYPGLQNVFGQWNNKLNSNKPIPSEHGKKLGCNVNDPMNKFDTFMQRHHCLHYKIENYELIEYYALIYNISITKDYNDDKSNNNHNKKVALNNNRYAKNTIDKNNENNKYRMRHDSSYYTQLTNEIGWKMKRDKSFRILSNQREQYPERGHATESQIEIENEMDLLFEYLNRKSWYHGYELKVKMVIGF